MSYLYGKMERRDENEAEAKRQRSSRPVPIQYSEGTQYQSYGLPPVSMPPDENVRYVTDRSDREVWNPEMWELHGHPSTMAPPGPFYSLPPGQSPVPAWQDRPGIPRPTGPTMSSWMEMSRPQPSHGIAISSSVPPMSPHRASYEDYFPEDHSPPEKYIRKGEGSTTRHSMDIGRPESKRGRVAASSNLSRTAHPKRRSANRDEFDGSVQYLDKNAPDFPLVQENDLPRLETSLYANEQDDLLSKVNDCLSKCAFDFVAKFQFPIPLESDKREVSSPGDREWTEWVHLLKRLATKRRIPARVLYNGQIKQFVTVLENSSEMRHAAKHQSRPLKDDRNVLQLISAGTQVAKILKDGPAMEYLDRLYTDTERLISSRKGKARTSPPRRQVVKFDL